MPGTTVGPGVITKRVPKQVCKRFTFSNAAGLGAIGTVPLLTVKGCVLFTHLVIRCISSLTGATATIALGTVGNTAGLIAATTGTNITAGKLWVSTSPATGNVGVLTDQAIAANIIATVAVANLTGGVIEIEALWLPLSSDGNVA